MPLCPLPPALGGTDAEENGGSGENGEKEGAPGLGRRSEGTPPQWGLSGTLKYPPQRYLTPFASSHLESLPLSLSYPLTPIASPPLLPPTVPHGLPHPRWPHAQLSPIIATFPHCPPVPIVTTGPSTPPPPPPTSPTLPEDGPHRVPIPSFHHCTAVGQTPCGTPPPLGQTLGQWNPSEPPPSAKSPPAPPPGWLFLMEAVGFLAETPKPSEPPFLLLPMLVGHGVKWRCLTASSAQ